LHDETCQRTRSPSPFRAQYSADKARQRDIIHKSPAQRVIFIAGLAAAIAIALALAFQRF
jgi:hypothetical protein